MAEAIDPNEPAPDPMLQTLWDAACWLERKALVQLPHQTKVTAVLAAYAQVKAGHEEGFWTGEAMARVLARG